MSSTNKTTNYQLSQFIGTDKPAWLSDYNGDMGKIDAGVAAAQSTATGADGKATANATAIGTLSSLTTEAKTNLVAAVNEVNTSAATALNTATNAAGNASQAKNATDDLKSYLAMTNFRDIDTSEVIASVGTVDHSWLKVARNADGTLGKIYGRIDHIASANAFDLQTLTVNVDTGLRPESDFDIVSGGIAQCMDSTKSQENIQVTITVKTTGKLVLTFYSRAGGVKYGLIFPPCLYFIQDFGDTPAES